MKLVIIVKEICCLKVTMVTLKGLQINSLSSQNGIAETSKITLDFGSKMSKAENSISKPRKEFFHKILLDMKFNDCLETLNETRCFQFF